MQNLCTPGPASTMDTLAALLAPVGGGPALRLAAAPAVRAPGVRAAVAQAAVARALCTSSEENARAADRAVLDEELARLLAARELFMAWVERTASAEGRASLTPAQFLRAWGESTGRVIQLLRARRELAGGSETDALLDAVYAELEAELLRAAPPASPEEGEP
jgi:hypothetical protein